MRKLVLALVLPLLMTGGAQGQAVCPALAASNVEVKAATASPELEPARLMLGQAANVTLHPGDDLRLVIAPEKKSAAGSFGGMLVVDVREAGTYQVTLSGNAWIDLVRDGAVVASGAHGHDGGCKMVSFGLTPGRHVIQLSGNKEDSIKVMVSRK